MHHERPDNNRGLQTFWVQEDIKGPWFCSIECSVYFRAEAREYLKATDEEKDGREVEAEIQRTQS